MTICQSCGMPMNKEELFGKEKDGSKSKEYCIYCYPEGEFNNPDETLQEMIDTCIPFMVETGMSESDARKNLETTLPKLKRWNKN